VAAYRARHAVASRHNPPVNELASDAVMGSPGPCPACESVELQRRGGKDFCPQCYYIQPCCDGGECAV